MDANSAIDLARQAVSLTLLLAAPTLLAVLVVSLAVSLVQAVTQVQEFTLTFVPKIVVGLLVLLLTGGWMLSRLVEFSRDMFGQLP